MVPLEEIFCLIDDFCKYFEQQQKARLLPNPNRKRAKPCALSMSEIMTIMVLFHLSHYRTFKDFYRECLSVSFKKEFPKLVSYNRFVELMPYAAMPLLVLASSLTGKLTGKYYIDSTKLQVCENLRIPSNKVFKNLAKRGKTSTGWFFGFKLHLIINDKGEIMSFKITPGNTDDRSVVRKMTHGLEGWLFGDKGYIGKDLTQDLKHKGLELITKGKKNMKEKIIEPVKKLWLDKRGVVESTIDQLKAIFHIQHTRHRSPNNFITNVLAGVLAYIFKPKKPSVTFAKSVSGQAKLMSN